MNREELKQVEMRHGAKRFRLSCPVAWEHVVRESANLHEYLALFLSRDDVVIDAAPGYGRGTVFFAGVVGCRVTAVVADQNAALLQGNLEANGLLPRIAVIDVDALRERASAIPAGRLRLVRIDENVAADAIEALVAALVRDRAVLVCTGLGSDASAALALRLSAHRYTALATLDESRCFLMAPVGDSREIARLARFLRCCPAWGAILRHCTNHRRSRWRAGRSRMLRSNRHWPRLRRSRRRLRRPSTRPSRPTCANCANSLRGSTRAPASNWKHSATSCGSWRRNFVRAWRGPSSGTRHC
jgi:hypothetical protein